MAKKVQTGKVEAKTDQVVQQVVQQVMADSVSLTSKDSGLTVKCGSESIVALYAKNARGNLVSFPSFRLVKGEDVGHITIGSTEMAKVFKTDENGVLELGVYTTGKTTIYTLFVSEVKSAVISG